MEYYNASCPADAAGPDGHVWAGCVATAMAQVMKYHNYPTTGTGSHSYSHPTYGTLSANFGETTYNWASMPDSLSDYNSDVAKLLYHIGVSVDMDYAPDGSGAYMSDAAYALETYFKYSNSLSYVWKSSYSTDEWTTILRTEIDNKRPILYSGHGTGGHAFVCDGYSGSDYFHFNWGWGGSEDNYFYLNDLTPGSYDFTDSQGAVIGIRPPLPPVGSFDSATCDSLSGWTKDPDTASPISVHFYKDGPAGTGTYLGSTLADIYRGDLSYVDKNHGFSFAMPDSLNDGTAHQIYAYGIDSTDGTNPLLTNSPKTVQCGLTPDQLTAVMSVINDIIMEDSPLPDLTVINPSASKTAESLTFSATAKNGGTGASAATTLRWYRSTDATISTADTQLGSQAVAALSADQTSAQSTSLPAPSTPGTYWLGACVDAVSGESSTTNNCSAGVQITVTAPAVPDLTVISPSASKTALAPGESLSFSATVKNGGDGASAATTLRWYRSTDATISTADTQLGSQAVAALSADQTSAQSTSLPAPSTPGTYWFGACADAVSGESSTTNNCSAGVQITVTAPAVPDLTVISPSASKTALAPSESLTFSATVKNSGTASAAATTLRWYRSTDATISTADTALGSAAVGALSATQTSAQSATLTAPATAGTYWLGACVDAVSGENSTTNNCSAGVQITVTITGKPDLTVSSLQFPYQFDAGGSGSVTAGFYNQGTLDSVATTATCYSINKATQAISGAVCQMQVPVLAVNQTGSRTATLTAPCDEGDYQLKVCVNSGANAESNTGNNCMYGDFSVIGNCQKKVFLPAVLEILLKSK